MPEFGGEVTNPKIFIGNKTITPDGIWSEQIFGPIKSHTCACGRFTESSKILYEGQTCPKCGIKCISNEARLKTFGKITLVFPVIKPTKRKYIRRITGKAHKQLLDPQKADASASMTRYLAIDPSGSELTIVDSLSNDDLYVLPLRITGIYSFILALRYVAERLQLNVAKELFQNNYITNTILVHPPEVRPIIRDPKNPNELRITKLNKFFVRLLQLNKTNNVIKEVLSGQEQDWLDLINYNFANQLEEEIVDQLIIEYDKITARYQYLVNKIYEISFDTISGKYGFIRHAMLGKTIEFSARSVITTDPSLPPYKIRVSKRILYKLWFPYFLYYMKEKYPSFSYIDLYDRFVVSDYEENKKYFDEFLEYFLSEEQEAETPSEVQVIRKKIIRDDD